MTTASSSPTTPPPPGHLLVLPMPDGQQVVALVAGEADLSSAPLLRDGIVDCLVYRPRSLVVDATDLTFCDLSGLDALVEAVAVVERSGVSVTVRPSVQLAWLLATVEPAAQTSRRSGQGPSGCPLPRPVRQTA